jgi:hypothetical protein
VVVVVVLRDLDGFLDNGGVLVVGGRGVVVVVVVGSVKGRLGDVNLFLVDGTRVRVGVARRGRAGSVDGGLYADIFLVAGGVTGAVFTFNLVNRAVVRAMLMINLNVTVGLGRVRRSRPFGRSVFLVVLVTMDTGTAVLFLFTCDADLFFPARRKLSRDRGGRVLTYPSGFLRGKLDLELLVGLSGGLDLSGLFVGRGEDAEGNGDAGFKVQVGDLGTARESFSTTFR